MYRLPSVVLVALAVAGPLSAQQEQASVAGRCLTADSIDVRGHVRVTREAIVTAANLTFGALNFPSIQRAIKDIFAKGDFENVAITCEFAGDQPLLVVSVVERPVLGRVVVEGPRRLSERSVSDKVDLLLGRPVDPADVALTVRRIDSLYKANGYYLAKVVPETTLVQERLGITFRVDEGRRLAVSGVRIDGNVQVPDGAIVSAMKTKPEGFWWWRKGEFDEDVFAADIGEKIPTLFAERGYADFQIDRDTLLVDEERGKALVEITIREGDQYRVKGFEIVGNRRFTTEQISSAYPFTARAPSLTDRARALVKKRPPATDIFDRTRWEEATQAVSTMYNNEGYIYAQVRPVVEKDPADSSGVVRLRWDIVEGTPAIINRVEVLGNDYTSEACIRDQLVIIPGDVFNQDRMIRSWRSIANLGFFESPIPFPDVRQANEAGDVDIIFRVKEKRTGQVNFGASMGQGTGLGGFIGLEQPNLFGKCKRGNINWQFGQYINDFQASYTDPNIKGSLISGQVTGYRSQARYRIADVGRAMRIGGSTRVGFPIPGSRFTRGFVSYALESVRYGEDGLLGTVTTNDCAGCLRSTLGFDVTRDTRLDMPFATEGQLQSLSAQVNGGILGGTASFQRYTAEFRSYSLLARLGGGRPGAQPFRLTFGLSARSGAVVGDPKEFFWTQKFALGGVQFGEMLRGYPEFSISPDGFLPSTGTYNAQRSSFGSAFFASTAEIGLRFQQSVYVNVFYDAGNLWQRPRDFDPTRLFRGSGFGLSTITPLGPLGVDYAYGFDRRNAAGLPDPRWQLHFRLGQVF